MISIKDYAKQKNVSYEAVRKQLVRYKDELQSHITTKNRMRFLDDYAVNFLDPRLTWGRPVSSAPERRCATAPSSGNLPWWEKTVWWAILWN